MMIETYQVDIWGLQVRSKNATMREAIAQKKDRTMLLFTLQLLFRNWYFPKIDIVCICRSLEMYFFFKSFVSLIISFNDWGLSLVLEETLLLQIIFLLQRYSVGLGWVGHFVHSYICRPWPCSCYWSSSFAKIVKFLIKLFLEDDFQAFTRTESTFVL